MAEKFAFLVRSNLLNEINNIGILTHITMKNYLKSINRYTHLSDMPDNPNNPVTRADLNQQLEIHAKTIELQILLSRQQEELLEKIDDYKENIRAIRKSLQTIEDRTWKQGWLFWGIIFSMLSTAGAVITNLAS